MRFRFAIMSVVGLLLAGCGDNSGKPSSKDAGGAAPAAGAPSTGPGRGSPPMGPPGMGPGGPGPDATVEMTIPTDPKPVAITGGVAKMTPENSKIEFIGSHTGARPDPRLGGFEKFAGQAEADADANTLKSVSLEIDAKSLWTQIGGPLTSHLKNPDFFDVNEFPIIAFKSANVDAVDAAAGTYNVTGNLTLHGVSKTISIPVTCKIGSDGMTLISQFTIDRTEFGMATALDRVEKSVSLSVVIGDKTQVKTGGGFGGPGRGGPGGGAPSGG